MKLLSFIPGILLFLSFNNLPECNYPVCTSYADTGHIIHVLDGSTAEWPDTIFRTDKTTSISYAVDNNAQYLFLALRIADFKTQMKLIRQGMNLFIDVKGKRKENRGIEFPIKRPGEEGFSGGGFSNPGGNRPNQQGNEQWGKVDKKAIRESMGFYLFAMKIFGFTDGEPTQQGLQVEGSANIGFSWDSSDVMHMEYFIPLSMLGDAASLNQKTISLGWKINTVESPSGNTPAFSTTTVQGRPAGSGGASRNGGGGIGNLSTQADMQKMVREENFWTKYLISI